MNRTGSTRARTRGLLVAAALSLHVAVLLPIALSLPRTPPATPLPEVFVVPLDLTEPLSRRTGARRNARRSETDTPSAPNLRPAAVAATAAPVAPVDSPPAPPARTVDAAGQPIADPWRVRRGSAPGGLPCPAPPGDRLGARLCLVGPAPDRDRDPGTYAELGPPRRDRSEQAREDGFERQAQANGAWRAYTRGEGAYPGLRSLFSER